MEEARKETSNVMSDRRLKIALAAVAGAVVIFLIGFLPPTLRARRMGQELEQANARAAETQAALQQAQFNLQVARLRGTLGEVMHEASLNNFGTAATHATAFFDGVQQAVNDPRLEAVSTRQEVLARTLARRDEIAADLARADPAARQKLAEIYIDFGAAVAP
ncbi:MAG TPA: hypothetical protein VNA04_15730 [Thermoanaerobaculia bacterium]|nr:hypothetical protein [Thermoanaerobaculia bacterium]